MDFNKAQVRFGMGLDGFTCGMGMVQRRFIEDLDRFRQGSDRSRYGLDSVDIGFRSCLRGVDWV